GCIVAGQTALTGLPSGCVRRRHLPGAPFGPHSTSRHGRRPGTPPTPRRVRQPGRSFRRQHHDARRAEASPWTRLLSDDRLTWTITEAAQLLGISRATAYEAAHRGELPVRLIGRRMLVP